MLFSSDSKVMSHMAFIAQAHKMSGHKVKMAALCTSGAACASQATATEMNGHVNGRQISW